MNTAKKTWKCDLCGYVHHGETAPESCPICGASASEFSAYEEPKPQATKSAVSKWRCIICTYMHTSDTPPESCPLCGAEREQFEPINEAEKPHQMQNEATRIIIVGGGIAGVSAAESIRQNSDKAVITLISSEPGIPYYRLNLTRYLAGEIDSSGLMIHPQEWYQENSIELLAGKSVESISPEDKTITLGDGTSLSYDKLILTSGSHPFIPPIPGSDLTGVYTLRTASDADRIIDGVKPGEPCVCIGGGILGLETAGALAKRGADVSLLESHDWLMPRQLNEPAACRIEAHMKNLGIRLIKPAHTAELIGTEGQVSGVQLTTGEKIPCKTVIICTGVRPNSCLARKAGLEVNRGIVVDNHLRTSSPDIFAAGDVAEHNGVVYGIWGPAQYQGSIAGLNAIGEATTFGGVPRSNALKVLGIEMLSIGDFTPTDGSFQVIKEESEKEFFHFVFRDGKMIGAILLGNIEAASKVKKAIESKKDFSGVLSGSATCAYIVEAL